MSPRVSIVMPVYKAEDYIHRSVDSILSQSLADFELLLVEDGSPDSSGIICDQYASNDSRVRVIHQSNKGVSAAREAGMGYARGEYVIHADPDDWVDSSMLYDLYTEAKKQDADMVICDFYDEYPWGTLYQTQSPNELTSDSVLRGLFENLHGSCCNKLIKRDSWEKANIHFPVGMDFCEDLYVNVSFLLAPLKIAYLPKAYYHYDHTVNDSSITKTKVGVDKLLMRVERISPLIQSSYPELVEKMKYIAKQSCIKQRHSYSVFNSVYPDVKWNLFHCENSYMSLRFASMSSFSYWLTIRWFMLKDMCFTIRNFFSDSRLYTMSKFRDAVRSIVPEKLWVSCAQVFKQNLVRVSFFCWRLSHKHPTDIYAVPIIINNYNRLTYLQQLIDSLKSRGYNNIYIIDNNSTYQQLKEFYKHTDCKLFLLESNIGYKALWETGIIKQFNSSFYVYSDSDVVLDNDCPKDFMRRLFDLSYKYPHAQKVGLGIHIDDLPDCFELKHSVVKHESQFWMKEVEKDVFDARIDTTFALYKPYFGSVSDRSQLNLRTGGKYMIHHMPWYVDSNNMTEEDLYYVNAVTQSTHWSRQQK